MAGYKFGKTFENDYFKKTFEGDYFKKGAYTPSEAVQNAASLLESHQKNNNPGAYKPQWDTQIKDLIGQIQGRDEFTYDLNGDALYQQLKDKYIKLGKMAMGDAIGQASAMTGGYGNSYAQSVGQQAYQAQLEHLNDIVPELYQMGLDKYIMEGQELYNQYGMLSNQDAADYGKHRDKVADYNAMLDYLSGRYDSERSFDYGKYADERDFAYTRYDSDRGLAYNEYRNDIADDQWQKQYGLSERELAMKEEAWNIEKEQSGYGEPETVLTETKNANAFKDRYNKDKYLAKGHTEGEWLDYIESNIVSFLRDDRIDEKDAAYLIEYYGLK